MKDTSFAVYVVLFGLLSVFAIGCRMSPGGIDGEGISGKVHNGFINASNALWLSGVAADIKAHPSAKYWVTGDSLGGAVATLTAAKMLDVMPVARIMAVYTYGSPRVGKQEFMSSYNGKLLKKHVNITYGADLVTHLAPTGFDETKAIRTLFENAGGMLGYQTGSMAIGAAANYQHVGRMAYYGFRNLKTLVFESSKLSSDRRSLAAAVWQNALIRVGETSTGSAKDAVLKMVMVDHLAYPAAIYAHNGSGICPMILNAAKCK